jgi:serine/threonine protein kinase
MTTPFRWEARVWSRDTVLQGRYRLVERVGRGAMGDVWEAWDVTLQRTVAVKLLLPGLSDDAQFVERFQAESRVLARLTHRGIVTVHDCGISDQPDCAYLVMEFLHGRPLSEIIADAEILTPARTLSIVVQTLDALQAAHALGIVHRDVKPANLLLDELDQVTVTDFGVAHTIGGQRLTTPGTIVGTALYRAPELLREDTTAAADLYSVGALAYECLTGAPPFDGDDALTVLMKHAEEPVPALPACVPIRVQNLVQRALAKRPESRFADAAEMADAARAALAQLHEDVGLQHHSGDAVPYGPRGGSEESVGAGEGKARILAPSVVLASKSKVPSPRQRVKLRTGIAAVIAVIACSGAVLALADDGSDASGASASSSEQPVSAPTTAASVVTGRLSCTSGQPVIGVWVQADSGAGFATLSPSSGEEGTVYSYRLPSNESYSMHIGCGQDSNGQWEPVLSPGHRGVHTVSVTGSDHSFTCHDMPKQPYFGTCLEQ